MIAWAEAPRHAELEKRRQHLQECGCKQAERIGLASWRVHGLALLHCWVLSSKWSAINDVAREDDDVRP